MRGVTPKLESKYDLRVVHYKGTRATCQQELELSRFKSWQWLRLEAHLGDKRHPTFALFCRLGSAGRGSKRRILGGSGLRLDQSRTRLFFPALDLSRAADRRDWWRHNAAVDHR